MATRLLAPPLGMLLMLLPLMVTGLAPGGATEAEAAAEGKVVIAQGVDPTTLDPHLHLETPASKSTSGSTSRPCPRSRSSAPGCR